METYVLVAYTASGIPYPSIRYKLDGLIESLQIMGIEGFGAEFQFFLWDDNTSKYTYGLVNLAAFLANAMVESIQYDSCDENNWQEVAGRYAISNSCGQEGRSYQDEDCGEVFSCKVDPMMEITAITSANTARAPPPFKCEPGTANAGYWNTATGTEITNSPYSNTAGRTDTEGCCWWGRGALLTKNVCNIGKFNYYLGKGAALGGRKSVYPTIDFCQYPEATCSSAFSEQLRWTMAEFEWAERIQRYNQGGFSYEQELYKFLDGGMVDDSFIASTSRILSLGCHKDDCSTLEVRMADERMSNFYLIINDVFDIKSLLPKTPKPTSTETPPPSEAYVPPTTPSPLPLPVLPPSLLQPRPPDTPNPTEAFFTTPATDYPTYTPIVELESGASYMKTGLKLMWMFVSLAVSFCHIV